MLWFWNCNLAALSHGDHSCFWFWSWIFKVAQDDTWRKQSMSTTLVCWLTPVNNTASACLSPETHFPPTSLSLSLSLSLRAKELRRQQRYRDKSHYQPGVWNVNTVLMGGLGADPDSSSSSEEGRTMQACTCTIVISSIVCRHRIWCLKLLCKFCSLIASVFFLFISSTTLYARRGLEWSTGATER